MSMQARTRMISFRLKREEFDQCRDLCFRNGMRSVSEMARVAIKLLLEQPSRASEGSIECRLSDVECRLNMLALEIKRVNHNSEALPAGVSSVGAGGIATPTP